jgi:hypothetical protein
MPKLKLKPAHRGHDVFGFDVTIGADPELFAYDTSSQNYVSAHEFIPGSKEEPVSVPLGAIQLDGVAAEFNIAPAKTQKEFLKNIKAVRKILNLITKRHNENYVLVEAPTAFFSQSYFNSLPETVLVLGCTPDYNAYTLEKNKKPETVEPMRTGSGHIHIGFVPDLVTGDLTEITYMKQCASLVQELDFVFQTTAPEWDKDTVRKNLYGAWGSFRPKPYGVEYRPLSNAWLGNKWSQQYVYDLAKAVTTRWLKGFSIIAAGEKEGMSNEIDRMDLIKFGSFLGKYNLPDIIDYSPLLARRYAAAMVARGSQ